MFEIGGIAAPGRRGRWPNAWAGVRVTTIHAAPEAPLPHDEIAEQIAAAARGDPDSIRRARLLSECLPDKVAANLMAEVHQRVLASPYCGGGQA